MSFWAKMASRRTSPMEKSRAKPAFSGTSVFDICLGRVEGAAWQERRGQHGAPGAAELSPSLLCQLQWCVLAGREAMGRRESAVKTKYHLITTLLSGRGSTKTLIHGTGVYEELSRLIFP